MNEGLNGIKNIIWALGIAAALIALLVGLVFSISNRFYGEREELTLNIGSSVGAAGKTDPEPTPIANVSSGTLNELPSTQDAGLEYVFNITFLCDSTIASISDYSASIGGTATAQLWTDPGAGLPASGAASALIVYPGDGSQISASNAAMVAQPRRLAIYLGGDGLTSATQDSFVSGYTELIRSIQSASPSTTVICCSVASVSAAYPGADGLSSELIATANGWIKTVCANTGAYYADLASVLNDDSGFLNAEYASGDGRTVNSAGVSRIMEYFRMHAV